jgi:asparagine synthetase B (glutamine-hydrolysing)
VVLDGQGADEILAGYYGYPGQRALSLLETEGIIAAHSFIKKWSIIYKKNYFLGWMYFFRLILSDRWYQIFHKLLNKIFFFSLSKNFNPKWFKSKNKNKINLKENRYILKKENSPQSHRLNRRLYCSIFFCMLVESPHSIYQLRAPGDFGSVRLSFAWRARYLSRRSLSLCSV